MIQPLFNPGITSTQSTAHPYSRIYPLHLSKRRKFQNLDTICVKGFRTSPAPVGTFSSAVPGVHLIIPDSPLFVAQTASGHLTAYSLASDPNTRMNKPSFVHSSPLLLPSTPLPFSTLTTICFQLIPQHLSRSCLILFPPPSPMANKICNDRQLLGLYEVKPVG